MLVTESGITTEVSLIKRPKTASPMLVTESGITTEVSRLNVKASSPMLVTESGINLD